MNPTNSKKREGVTSFLARHTTASLDSTRYGPLAGKMAGWRTVLAQLGLTGLDPNRYDGVGYGNISGRIGPFPGQRGRRAFLVSGTQTGALDCVGLEEFALVERAGSCNDPKREGRLERLAPCLFHLCGCESSLPSVFYC